MGKYHKKMIVYGILGLVWGLVTIFCIVSHMRPLFIVMTLSLTASNLIYAYTSHKEQLYVDKYGDPTIQKKEGKKTAAIQKKEEDIVSEANKMEN